MIFKHITYFGQPQVLACDAMCHKAWGINSRPTIQLSENPDDYAYLSDGELGVAPKDPGTYEGDQAKPIEGDEPLNKWCCRECERSVMADQVDDVSPKDFSQRRYNIASRNAAKA